MRFFYFCLALSVLLSPVRLAAATHQVDSGDAIAELLDSGRVAAGDNVVWTNGVFSDQEIELNGVDGTATQPITLRAEKPGGVILRGESQVRTNAKWWVIEGFRFDGIEGGPNAYNPIQLRGSGDVGAEHVRITNCAFTSLNNDEETAKWVQIYGRFNQVDHCHFSHKPNKGALMTVELDGLVNGESAEHVIEWNYFADVVRNEGSDNETIRIGFSGDQNKSARCVVQHNLFLRCNGESEIVSNKSSYNEYKSNTFRQCNGSLVLRHGHHATVSSNYFLGEGADDAGGIRINDSHHRVFNNYMQDLTGLTWNAALSIEGGKKTSGGDSSGYQVVDDVTIVHNSIINCAKSVYLNDKHGNRPPTGVVANNLVAVDEAKKILLESSLPADGLTWEKNVFYGAELHLDIPALREDPSLVGVGGVHRPTATSLVVGAARGGFDFVTSDIEDQPRKRSARDIGADEVVADDDGKPLRGALKEEDVGTSFSVAK